MRCCVLVLGLLASAGAAAAAAASCAASQEFFLRHNVSADDSDGPGAVCGGHCCGRGREARLRHSLRRTAEKRAAAATRPIAELLLTTRRTLQDHLTLLSHQSQNKSAAFFSQMYRGMAARTHSPLSALYADVRTLLRPTPERDVVSGEDLALPPPRDLEESVRKFFRELFPVAYHHVLKLEGKQFTREYEACLVDAYDAVQPFGEVPHQLGISLSHSLEAARALLQVLAVGAGALATSEQILSAAGEEWSDQLLRVGGCARCRGHDARPCRNYCLNVARGSVGALVSELEAPWAGYVEGVERLARADADTALRGLSERLSQAIMHMLENHVVLENKVRSECGPPSTSEGPSVATPRLAAPRAGPMAPPPDTELLQFAASLAESKRLFSGLADRLCDEPDFEHLDNNNCWNGQTVGEYTKSLVASASQSDQKYNPEVKLETPADSRVATLADRLRQARQLLVSHSTEAAPAAEAFMQGDEAGEEGSGSGRSFPDDYDAEGSGEEGSGMPDGGVDSRTITGDKTAPEVRTPNISGAASAPHSALTGALLLPALLYYLY